MKALKGATLKDLIEEFLEILGADEKRKEELLIKTEKAIVTKSLWLMDEKLDDDQKRALERVQKDADESKPEDVLKKFSKALGECFSEKEIKNCIERASAGVFIKMVESALPECTQEHVRKLKKMLRKYFPELRSKLKEG